MRAITKAKDESKPKGRRRHLALPRINIGTEKKKKKKMFMENTSPYAHGHFPPSFSTQSWFLLSGINRSGWEKQGKLSSGAFCPRAVPGLEIILDFVV